MKKQMRKIKKYKAMHHDTGKLVCAVAAALVLSCLLGRLLIFGGSVVHVKPDGLSGISENTGSMGSVSAGASPEEAREICEESPEETILVNRDHPLADTYDAKLQEICGGRLMASSRLYESLCQMLADAEDAGYTYWIASAYRSKERQQELVDEDVSALMQQGMSREAALEEVYKETMPPGCSEHETGLALDILVTENTEMNQTQEDEPGNAWLRENCAAYGFILRYPKDKEDITGVHYEPWHFRYVGKRAAEFMEKYGLTLEEFYDLQK